MVFDARYWYENLRLLAPAMPHEPLHRDTNQSTNEELVADAIESLVYGQVLPDTPSVATSGTALARFPNTKLTARLNTRDANGKPRLFTSQGNILPGRNFVPRFAAPYKPLGDSTPGNAVLKAMVRKVVGSGATLPTTVNFKDNSVLLLLLYSR